MNAEISPIGERTTSVRTKSIIADDLDAISTYNSIVFEDEKDRLRRLLFATVGIYIFGWILGVGFTTWLYRPEAVLLLVEHPWIHWLYYAVWIVTFAWIPLTMFLFAQGVRLRKKLQLSNFVGDQSVVSLSIVLPVVFFAVYVATRFL
jgi:hypothetical protein